jgi:hypothetical protein
LAHEFQPHFLERSSKMTIYDAAIFVAGLALASVSVSCSAAQPLEHYLTALEKQSWQAWQQQDAGFWDKFLSDDHVELGPYGASTKQQVVGAIARRICTVRSWLVDKFSYRRVGPDTAMLIYLASQDTSCGGTQVPSPAWASSVYQRRRGRWVNVYYAQTPVAVARH